MTDYDIHSCGYYCERPACVKAQRNELRDKLFSDQAVKTYSGGKPNYTQPDIPNNLPIVNLKQDELMYPTQPVAYINVEERKLEWAKPTRWETPTVVKMDKVPLYTKKEWVGLTDDETNALIRKWAGELVFEVTQALKEKNNG
jgi:hypothetical protein